MEYGIIQGCVSGGLEEYKTGEQSVETPYGRVVVCTASCRGTEVAYLLRHGTRNKYPPHQINARGNIDALVQLGVRYVLSVGTGSSLNPAYQPGEAVLLDDFADFTRSRFLSYHQDGERPGFTRMEEPYCPRLQEALCRQAQEAGFSFAGRGIYVCTEGPRYETRAEARFFQSMGWDVIGMTGVPEVVLAKERGLCYAGVCLIRDWGTGLGPKYDREGEGPDLSGVRDRLLRLFLDLFSQTPPDWPDCGCRTALYCP